MFSLFFHGIILSIYLKNLKIILSVYLKREQATDQEQFPHLNHLPHCKDLLAVCTFTCLIHQNRKVFLHDEASLILSLLPLD
jgi:hypothetical protein